MSTFTDGWNGPEGSGFNAVFFRKCIDDLKAQLDALAAKLPGDLFNTSKTVNSEIARLGGDISALQTKVANFSNSITTRSLLVQDVAGNKLLELAKDVFNIYERIQSDVGIDGDIDVKNVNAGPTLIFDNSKHASASTQVGGTGTYQNYTILAELRRVHDDVSPINTVTSPCTIYVYNEASPKFSAIIWATECGLAVLHSGRDFPNPPVDTSPPRVKYVVLRTGSEDNDFHYYVCMAMWNSSGIQVTPSAKVALINAKLVTAAPTGTSALLPAGMVETNLPSDFLVTHQAITNLTAANLKAANLQVTGITNLDGVTEVNGAANLLGNVVVGSTATGGARTLTVHGQSTFDDLLTAKKGLTVSGASSTFSAPVTINSNTEPAAFTVGGGGKTRLGELSAGKTGLASLEVTGTGVATGSPVVAINGLTKVTGNLEVSAQTRTHTLHVQTEARVSTLSVTFEASFSGSGPAKFFSGIAVDDIYTYDRTRHIAEYSDGHINIGTINAMLVLRGEEDRPNYLKGSSGYLYGEPLALLSDLVSAIIFEGTVNYYAQTRSALPKLGDKLLLVDDTLEAGKIYKTVTVGDTAIAFDDLGDISKPISRYELDSSGSWAPRGTVDPDKDHGDHSYQWHLDYYPAKAPVGVQPIWHETEMIWSPHLTPPDVSIIETHLVNYYTKPEVDRRIDTVVDLATRQSDWLAPAKITEDNEHNGVDNPAYIRNKPLMGLSVLDSGVFPKPGAGADYPATIVDGGNFDILGVEISGSPYQNYAALPISVPVGANWNVHDFAYVKQDELRAGVETRYKIAEISASRVIKWEMDRVMTDVTNLRQDVIIKIWSGIRWNGTVDQLPDGSIGTAHVLKWCVDTQELWMDTGSSDSDPSKGILRGNKLINYPGAESSITNLAIALGDDVPLFAPTYRLSVVEKITDLSGAIRTWMLKSADQRMLFTKDATPDGTVYSTLYLEDLLQVTASLLNVQTTNIDATTSTATLNWTQLHRGAVGTPAPTSEDFSFGIQAGNGLALTGTIGADTLATLSLHADVVAELAADTAALNTNIVYAADITDTTITFTLNKLLNPSATPSTKAIEFAANTGITATSLTVNDKTTLTFGLDTALTTRAVTGPVAIDESVPTSLALTFTSDTLDPTTPTVKIAELVAGTHLALTHATVNEKTTVTYDLSADMITALAGVFIKNIVPTAEADGTFMLAITSGQVFGGTDSTVSMGMKPGTGVTFNVLGTPTVPVLEISADAAPVPSTYADLTLTVPDSGAQATIKWSKCGPVVSLTVFQTSGVGGTLAGTFTETLPTDIIPPVEVSYMTLGESGYRSITLKTDGHVDYLMDVGNAGFKTTLTYFVGA